MFPLWKKTPVKDVSFSRCSTTWLLSVYINAVGTACPLCNERIACSFCQRAFNLKHNTVIWESIPPPQIFRQLEGGGHRQVWGPAVGGGALQGVPLETEGSVGEVELRGCKQISEAPLWTKKCKSKGSSSEENLR